MIRRWLNLAGDCAGTAAIEFGLLAPALFLLVVGMLMFGVTLNNYIMLTEATRAAGRVFALSRGAATPYTATVNQVYASATNLTQGSLSITLAVNGAACGTDAACATALTAGQGLPASLTVTYPCSLQVLQYNFAPSCTLSSQTAERIE